MRVEGDWCSNLVERGVKKNELTCAGRDKLDGEAGAIDVRGYEGHRSGAEAAGAGDRGAIGVETR